MKWLLVIFTNAFKLYPFEYYKEKFNFIIFHLFLSLLNFPFSHFSLMNCCSWCASIHCLFIGTVKQHFMKKCPEIIFW